MKKTIHIGMLQRTYMNEPEMVIHQSDMQKFYAEDASVVFYRQLEEREIEVPDLPPKGEVTRMKIDGLETYCEKVKADARAKVQQIEEQIANLRCLEHMTEDEGDA